MEYSMEDAHPLLGKLLNGSHNVSKYFNKKYKDTNKRYTSCLQDSCNLNLNNERDEDFCWNTKLKFHINMAQVQDINDHEHSTPNEELDNFNEVENSYTGMNKIEKKTARGAIEKIVFLLAYFITNVIVIYQDILLHCSSLGTTVGPPEPASQQSKESVSATNLIFYESCALKKVEVYSLFVYWYFVIMFSMKYFERWADNRFFGNYIFIYGYYVTPLLRYTLHQIYEYHRINDKESFEIFIKRLVLLSGRKYKDVFTNDEKTKIALNNKFDITLVNKCITISMDYYALWYSLNEIYESNRIYVTESFENFIKRAVLGSGLMFKDHFTNDEKIKISSFDDFNISLIKKCIQLCATYFTSAPMSVISKDYLDIKIISNNIKNLRNENFHNLPEPNINVCNNYYNNLNLLEYSIENLVRLLENRFCSSHIEDITKYMKLIFMTSKIPASFSDIILIILLIIMLFTYF